MSFLEQLEQKQATPERQVQLVYISSRPEWLSLVILAITFGASLFSVLQLPRLLSVYDRNDFQTVWPVLLCFLSFPLFGLAIYGVGRWLKFGESKLFYEKGCNVVGGHLRGYILAASPIVNATKINATLVCVQVKKGPMGSKSSKIEELCRSSCGVSPDAFVVDGQKYRIPIQLLLPLGGKATSASYNEPVIWTLSVHGEMPGIDYGAKFNLKVS